VQYETMYEPGSSGSAFKTSRSAYKQVALGYGSRSDFTKIPQRENPGAHYDAHSRNSMGFKSAKLKEASAVTNFGANYNQYEKAMVRGSMGSSHYLGKGPAPYLGNDGAELNKVKPTFSSIALVTEDRGLLSTNMRKMPVAGPGSYNIETPTNSTFLKKV